MNNDRSRDYTIPNVPMMNSQPSVMGQQPPPVGGPVVHPYNGPTQYAPATQGFGAPQHSAAGWNSPVGSAPPQMPMQKHNHHYSMPASGPPQMGHEMMPMHGQNGLPHSGGMPPYHPQ